VLQARKVKTAFHLSTDMELCQFQLGGLAVAVAVPGKANEKRFCMARSPSLVPEGLGRTQPPKYSNMVVLHGRFAPYPDTHVNVVGTLGAFVTLKKSKKPSIYKGFFEFQYPENGL
jgi:hypothetical protein